MTRLAPATIAATVFGLLIALSGCANTIEGVGEDTAQTVDAAEEATEDVVDAVN
ncbi:MULTISPECIES: hypothetical protein [unclassified Roseitalea]|uniref:entericidin domain-containing protein n=1 Tax=unclassified Roseitalea TaxID=2639107 RepID=UPI00273DDD72|nr:MULTISPECIES: hypothetical protein [unclassified Roseitalea]